MSPSKQVAHPERRYNETCWARLHCKSESANRRTASANNATIRTSPELVVDSARGVETKKGHAYDANN